MKRKYDFFLKDMLEEIKDIKSFTKDMSFIDFKKDKKTEKAVRKSFEIIGEASKNIPEEIKEKYKEVDWKNIIRHRDLLSHYYWKIDLKKEWEIVKEDLNKLEKQMKEIIKKEVSG